MRISEWLDATDDIVLYKSILAYAGVNRVLDPKARLAYYKLFHFHAHKDPELAKLAAETYPLSATHPVARRVVETRLAAERQRERESATAVPVIHQGPSQDIPVNGSWEGFGDICILVSRRVKV